MAIVVAAIFFNTATIGKLPILEGLAVVLHVFGFFAFIVIIVSATTFQLRRTAKQTLAVGYGPKRKCCRRVHKGPSSPLRL